eukprot:s705_g9.t1
MFASLKKKQGRKMPWPGAHRGSDWGYEEVFDDCWRGPKDFGALENFQDFADRYDLVNPSGSSCVQPALAEALDEQGDFSAGLEASHGREE